MGDITIEDLRKVFKDYNWEVLTEGDESLALRALDKAVTWAKAKIIQACGIYDDKDPIIRLAVLKRASYELYSMAENEAVAQDKKDDAMELLRARFGSSVDASGYPAGSSVNQNPIAVGAIVNGIEIGDKKRW